MIGDSPEEADRIALEMETLREINQSLVQENTFLKAEVARLKRALEKQKSFVMLPSRQNTNTTGSIDGKMHSSRLLDQNMPISMAEFQDEDDFQKRNFIVMSQKSIGGPVSMFEQVLLFGLSEASQYKMVEKLFAYYNPFDSSPSNPEATRAKEVEDLLNYIVSKNIDWKPVPQAEIPSEIHELS